jgi:hypothetical protein
MNNMKKYIRFWPLVFLFYLLNTTISIGQTVAPFYSETFPSAADFGAKWVSGGTNAGPEKWKWSDNPKTLFEGQPDFTSKTAANGFVIFNSEDNGEVPHDVFLTAINPVNCVGKKNIFLRFENQYAFYSAPSQSVAQVGISFDGTTFTYKTVLTDVTSNNVSASRQIVTLELPEAVGKEKVFIRFRWKGNYEYAWRLDDIALFEGNPQPARDLVVSAPILPESFAVPVSQVQEVPFVATVSNKGTLAQSKVKFSVKVISSNGQSFNADTTLLNLKSGLIDTFSIPRIFIPRDTGSYATQYAVTTDSIDEVPSDNSLVNSFLVTKNLYSKDDGILASATQPSVVSGDIWEAGNYYYVKKAGFDAYEATFSVASNGNTHQGKSISLLLYQYIDNGDAKFDDKDLKVVGYGFHEFKTEKNFEPITTPLLNLETNNPGVPLKADGDYVLMVQYAKDMFMPYSKIAYNYGQLSTIIKNGEWFGGGFGKDITAFVRMRIREKSTPVPVIQSESVGMEIFPNPAKNDFYVNIEAINPADFESYAIFDILGKKVWEEKISLSGNVSFKINAPLPDGSYSVQCKTKKGVITGKVQIVN